MAKDEGDGLSPKGREFCAQYVAQSRNATRAYMTVFPKSKERSAAVQASRLLRNNNIRSEIDRLTAASLKKSHATADEVLREMARVGMSDMAGIVWAEGELDSKGNATTPGTMKSIHEMPENARRAIASIEKDSDGNVKIKFWDKNVALGNLAKHHKLLTDKIELSGTIGRADRIRKARMRAGLDK